MELKIRAIDEQWEKKNKSLELKAGESDFDSDMALIVKKLKRVIKNEKKKSNNKKNMHRKHNSFQHA